MHIEINVNQSIKTRLTNGLGGGWVQKSLSIKSPFKSNLVHRQARTQELSQEGKFPREARKIFLPPPLALKMLLFYIKSTTCPLGDPFSIQGLYITMFPSV